MHNELWSQFELLDPSMAMQRAQCVRVGNSDCYTITFLNKPYMIDLQKREIDSIGKDSLSRQAGYLEQLCILAYLIHSKDVLPSSRLTKAETLPGGAFFFRGHHRLPTDKLEKVFGPDPESLYSASQPLGPQRCDFGDASIELLILPRVPVTFVIWAGDDEFPARASILFDATVSQQLPLDALHVAVHLAVKAITKPG